MATVARLVDEQDRVGAFAHLVADLRPGHHQEAGARVERLTARLAAGEIPGEKLGRALVGLLSEHRALDTLTESGVPSTRSFISELMGRIGRRLLPDLLPADDLRTVLRAVFSKPDDHLWVEAVPVETWGELLHAMGITAASGGRDREPATAVRVLAHHISSEGLQSEITSRLPHLEDPDSPFLSLSDRVLSYIRSREDGMAGNPELLLSEALQTSARCRAEVTQLRLEKRRYGTSLRLTGISFRLLRLLDRLDLLLHLTAPGLHFRASAVLLFRELVRAESTRNRLLPHMKERADLLAYQVVEHVARKGHKYIADNRHDYFRLFVSSLGGGLVVAVFALFKVLMSKWPLPLALEAFLYGVNYSICFVLIQLTGATLATKQPAMTANTIACALGDPSDRHLEQLEDLVVRVWRSQFVSFVGNLAMALPMAFLLSELFFRLSGKPVADAAKASSMLAELHPWHSGTLAFAAAAGVFLFSAGLVSGWVDNHNVYSRLPERVAAHPMLRRRLGEGRAARLGAFLDRNLGVVAGNVFLGFALGSLGTIGEILGLPLDIRHIAFASAHFGTSLEVLHFDVAWAALWPVAVGIGLIGWVNFVVSFGLSLGVALESRQITPRESRLLVEHLFRRFARRPLDWFIPGRGRA